MAYNRETKAWLMCKHRDTTHLPIKIRLSVCLPIQPAKTIHNVRVDLTVQTNTTMLTSLDQI